VVNLLKAAPRAPLTLISRRVPVPRPIKIKLFVELK